MTFLLFFLKDPRFANSYDFIVSKMRSPDRSVKTTAVLPACRNYSCLRQFVSYGALRYNRKTDNLQ